MQQTAPVPKVHRDPESPPPPPRQTVHPNRSVDMIEVIRRALRSYHFACVGAAPWVGFGMAWQAIRLAQGVWAELGRPWKQPNLWFFWAFTSAAVYGAGFRWGFITGTICAIFLWLIQTGIVWRRLPLGGQGIWNPAERHLRWGMVFAFTGIFWSMLSIVLAFALYSRGVPE